MSDRQGIEIDYCSKCRGVWLDRGELDKIIERSVREVPQPTPQAQPYREDRGHQRRDHDEYHHQKHYKQKSWLSELFD
ncbi:zf-TFIIB domain-containing protein [Dongia sp.]|uniref:TFIIB-type zinc ribbon-containing protein n=1 Tax=Dongia sp. TaxID=1977262 RepID=UPI0035B310D6